MGKEIEYTGYKDINGQNIYTGDIVMFKYRDGYGNIKKKKSKVFRDCCGFSVHLLKDYRPLLSNISDIKIIISAFKRSIKNSYERIDTFNRGLSEVPF